MVRAAVARPCVIPVAKVRVLLDVGDSAVSFALQDAFSSAGYEVRSVAHFQDLAAWLLLRQDPVTVVFQPPPVDALRKAMLRQLRRLAPMRTSSRSCPPSCRRSRPTWRV